MLTRDVRSFQQLQLLELVKAGRVEAALGWARAALAEAAAARPAALPELERSLALLAFPDPSNSPFSDLLQPQYSQTVSGLFKCILFLSIDYWGILKDVLFCIVLDR